MAFEVIAAEKKEFNKDSAVEVKEYTEEAFDFDQYSVSGWFKWKEPESRQPCHLMFRLTNNEKDYFQDSGLGDRTFAAFHCSDLHFSTYTIGTIDKDANPNVGTKIAIGEYQGVWNYVYFGYSAKARKAGVYVKYPDVAFKFAFDNVQHFVPHYLALYSGADGIQPPYSGLIHHLELHLGGSAYVNVEAQNAPELLPQISVHLYDHTSEWKVEGESLYASPTPDNSLLLEHEFGEEIEGTVEYSVGVWARWLTTYPKRLLKKDSKYAIYRLSMNKNYND